MTGVQTCALPISKAKKRAALFLALVFRRRASFSSRISIGKTTDVPPGLSSHPILDIDGLKLVSLYTDTLKDILLAKLAALSSYNTSYNISRLI